MAWQVTCDGNDITSIVQSIRWRPKLSRPASCIVRFPAHLFSITPGVSQLQLLNGGLLFSGTVWFPQSDGNENAYYTEITCYDHLIYLGKRLCKTPADWPDNNWPPITPADSSFEPGPCNLADPIKVITDYITGPEIMAAFIQATIDCDPGSFPLSVGSVATGGDDLTGVPADWPMTISAMAELLLSTGQLDIVVSPGYGSSTVDLYNGDYGTNLSGSVSIDYATGGFNARRANKTVDMEDVINALWYLLGPKVPQYDYDITHWAGSITPTAANAGPDGDGPIPGTPWPPGLVARWTNSRAVYGYMQEIQIHDTKEDENGIRPLFEEMFANEAYLRAVPRTIIAPSADRSESPPPYNVGDLISINAGSVLGGGFSGTFRVFEFEIAIDTDGIGDVTELVGSADGD